MALRVSSLLQSCCADRLHSVRWSLLTWSSENTTGRFQSPDTGVLSDIWNCSISWTLLPYCLRNAQVYICSLQEQSSLGLCCSHCIDILKWYALLPVLYSSVKSLFYNCIILLGYSRIFVSKWLLKLSVLAWELTCQVARNNGMIQWKRPQELQNRGTCPLHLHCKYKEKIGKAYEQGLEIAVDSFKRKWSTRKYRTM